ncbi:MAG: hypothetical protein GEV08_12660 [Acidimicrobiia bacterium]|nr:hypothetical protein [Acidimicrobiia bacterium]
MTVRKGVDWGSPGPLAGSGIVASSDAEARAELEAARRAARPPREIGLLGGDLCRTVGGLGDRARLRGPDAVRLSVDAVRAVLDGEAHWFLAHLVARGPLWRGRGAVVMNAEWLGPWRLGPRAHPGDGLLDATEGELGLRDRLQARRRARTGDHLPHPQLATRRAARHELRFERPVAVWLDGTKVGMFREVDVACEPDALTVVV